MNTDFLMYYKGVFDTYAIQNDPGANFCYSFDIDEFPVEDSLEESMKKHFEMFQEYELTFAEITYHEVAMLMHRWLYIEFKPNFINNISTKDVIQRFVSEMIEDLQLTTFHKITSITQNGIEKENEFGYDVDFIVLSSATQRYLCEFVMG
jgi:hypothetical protein